MNDALKKVARVQKVDTAILEAKRKFAAIDPGRGVQAARDAAQAAFDEAAAAHKALRTEVEDLELATKGIEQKIESEQKRLYSGGVYNAKDADAIDREVANLKDRRSKNDERILELWELIPPAKQAEETEAEKLKATEAKLAEYRGKYEKVRGEFEAAVAKLNELRAAAIQGVDPSLLAKYEQNRDRRHGIGLALVVDGQCTACNTPVPKKQLGDVVDGHTLQACENCFRFLYVDEKAPAQAQ